MPEPDAVDRIVLREAEPALTTVRDVVVIADETSDLAELVSDAWPPGTEGRLRVYTDSARTERVLAGAAARRPGMTVVQDLDAKLLEGAELVLLHLPKSLAELDEVVSAVARWAAPGVEVIAGGRVKHMSRGMNTTLEKSFRTVRASLGLQKARALLAADPRPDVAAAEPRRRRHEDLDLTLCAYGGTFAGPDVDRGSRLLVSCFDRLPEARAVVDLGSGSGLLAVLVARARPEATVVAVDDSRAAIRSTAATAAANDVAERIQLRHAERLDGMTAGTVDLVVCNPPFHRGTARDSRAALTMFHDAARVLRPGGELWVVFNSHLPYLTELRRIVGRTLVLAQDPGFTVARAVRRSGQPSESPS